MIEKVKKAWKQGNIRHKMFCYLLMILGYSNNYLQVLEVRNKTFNYLKRNYKNLKLDACVNHDFEEKEDQQLDVWICWFQGMENAPDIVRACFKSVKKYIPNGNIHVITSSNLREYVTFPDFVVKKWKKGMISNTHLSDILRLELLTHYGGLWLDATTYLTGPLPGYVTRQPLFMYSHSFMDDITIQYNSWLIYAEKSNEVLQKVLELLYEYWKRENHVREYFLWHLFMTLVVKNNPEKFKDIVYIRDVIPGLLSQNLFEKFNNEYWEEITTISSVHKLTYKFEFPENINGTYYEKILTLCC